MGIQLRTISGTLGGPTGLLPGIDLQDLFLIRIDDPAHFCATTVPCPEHCGSADFDTQLWLFDANGLGVLGNNDTAVGSGALGSPIVTGSTLGPFACDETGSHVIAPGLYYIGISNLQVPFSAGGPIFQFDDANVCGPGEVSGPDGPG